jgi:radical SAM superfamily enzyme YgiQ (UPF0313 family)
MKILLVLPAAGHLRVDASGRVPRRKMLRFSVLPLTTVAALTPPEHEVDILDENVEPIDLEADADVIGLSFMTAVAPRALELAREFRRRGKVVVAGGYHPTLCPDEVAPHVDAVVVGDAEDLWPRVLEDVERGRLRPVYRHDAPPDLAGRPLPRRDLTERTARHYGTVHAVQTTRGCPNGCSYCSIAAFHGRTQRVRPVEEVIAELRELPRNFMFVDDNIVGDPDHAKALFRAMIPLRKRWISQGSLDVADDPELLRLAREAGCMGLFIGIETLSRANLESFDKAFNRAESYRDRIGRILRAGIGVQAGMIVGADADDPGVFERTLRFLQRSRIDALQLNILTPLPGTPLHRRFEREGRILDHDRSRYDFRHVVIRPARMTPEELQAGADWLYAQFYRLDRILLRVVRLLLRGRVARAVLTWRLNATYRYDNIREGIVGRNPAPRRSPWARVGDLVRRLRGRPRARPSPA